MAEFRYPVKIDRIALADVCQAGTGREGFPLFSGLSTGLTVDSPRIARWLKEAAAHYATVYGVRPLQVILRDPHDKDARLIFFVPARKQVKSDTSKVTGNRLGDQQIYAAVGSTPIPVKDLARKLKRKLDSHFYAALRRMCDGDPPLLARTPKGIRRYK